MLIVCHFERLIETERERAERWGREKDRKRVDLARERKGGESYSQPVNPLNHPFIHPSTYNHKQARTHVHIKPINGTTPSSEVQLTKLIDKQ